MEIAIKKLIIVNFKKVKNLTVDFNQTTSISGDNATCKTTIFDAFTWLLFGKDSHDKKDFNIKTLDPTGVAIPMLNHEVSGVLSVDGAPVELRRLYEEEWTKKRGSEIAEFTGHKTSYFYNGIPLSQKEYQVKIDSICNETLFKLITNPLFFPSTKWQDQRSILFDIAGNITNEEVASSDVRFKELLDSLSGKSIEEYKKQIASKKKELKDKITLIPSRVDEAMRMIPEKVEGLEKEKEELVNSIRAIDEAMADTRRSNLEAEGKRKERQSKVVELSNKQMAIIQDASKKENDLYYKALNQKEELKRVLSSHESTLSQLESEHNTLINKGNTLSSSIEIKRGDFAKVKAEEYSFKDNDLQCPLCKREYENLESKKETLLNDYNNHKANSLKTINEEGLKLKNELLANTTKISEISAEISSLKTLIEESKTLLSTFNNLEFKTVVPQNLPEWNTLQQEIDTINSTTVDTTDISDLISERQLLDVKLGEVNKKIQVQSLIPEIEKRVEELNNQLKTLSQELASFEKVEFIIQDFTKAKIGMVENRINSLFEVVRFKLFNTQINGGEEETCEISVDGVPFSDLNTAMKTYAGMDVINAISKHKDVYAPIFIDNRESITRIPKTHAQIINLLKVTGQKELMVKHTEDLKTA